MVKRPSRISTNPLPTALGSALFERRRNLVSIASGRVLDLGGWSDHLGGYGMGDKVASVTILSHADTPREAHNQGKHGNGIAWVNVELERLGEAGLGRFDTIVSLVTTPFVTNRERFLRTITELLADSGQLLLLEPVVAAKRNRRIGAVSAIKSINSRFGRAVKGLHLGWDLPAAVRDLGMTITDLDRFEVRAAPAPLRSFVQAKARWPLNSLESSSSPESSPS